MEHKLTLKPGDTLNAIVENVVTPPVNMPPLVNVGLDRQIKLPISEVDLVGTVSDPENDALIYAWTKVSGGSANISTPTAKNTKVTGLAVGNYTFKLTVKDKINTTSKDLNVVVLPADVVTPPASSYLTLQISASKTINGQSNVVIENLRFENSDIALRITSSSNITVRNCFFNKAVKEAVDLYGCTNVTVENCLFNGVASGVYALNCQGVKVRNNQMVNPHKRTDDNTRGQLAQFNSVGGTGNEIINNRSESFNGEGNPEDHISLYNSSNVLVEGNILRGGGPSDSGSGIMTGDNGGSNQTVRNNILVNTGNAGIGVAGGNNVQILNNKIWSDRNSVSNNPLYVWSQSAAGGSNVTVKGNIGKWIDKNGGINKGWNAQNIPNTTYEYLQDVVNGVPVTLASFNVPDHLITFISPAELLKIRGK